MEKFNLEKKSLHLDYLPQSEVEWLETNKFNIEMIEIKGHQIRCALTHGTEGERLVTMVGGIPRDPERCKKLPLINKLYGHLALKLLDHNESSLLYNQPATGGSNGEWEVETFQSRIDVLTELVNHFHKRIMSFDHSLIGASAGAYMAVEALEQLQIQGLKISKLILLSPAAYPKNIEHIPYGQEFTDSIRKPWKIEESPVFSKLEKYVRSGGSAYITFFEIDDPPIPYQIQKYYEDLAKRLSAEGGNIIVTIIPGVTHNFRKINLEVDKNIVNNDSIRTTANQFIDFLTKTKNE
ncbi:MAG: hypothetical protein ABH808_00435 [Candidatus Kuenenbacteria bacterium]